MKVHATNKFLHKFITQMKIDANAGTGNWGASALGSLAGTLCKKKMAEKIQIIKRNKFHAFGGQILLVLCRTKGFFLIFYFNIHHFQFRFIDHFYLFDISESNFTCSSLQQNCVFNIFDLQKPFVRRQNNFYNFYFWFSTFEQKNVQRFKSHDWVLKSTNESL